LGEGTDVKDLGDSDWQVSNPKVLAYFIFLFSGKLGFLSFGFFFREQPSFFLSGQVFATSPAGCLCVTVRREVTYQVPTVFLGPNESQENLLRRFRKEVTRSGVLTTLRKKRWYVSKSEERRRAKKKAIRKARQRELRMERRSRN